MKSCMFYLHIRKISKTVYKTTLCGVKLSSVCCTNSIQLKEMHAKYILNASDRIKSSERITWQKFSCKQLCWFLECSAGTKNQDCSVTDGVSYSNICYWSKVCVMGHIYCSQTHNSQIQSTGAHSGSAQPLGPWLFPKWPQHELSILTYSVNMFQLKCQSEHYPIC